MEKKVARILTVMDFSENSGEVLEQTRHHAIQEKADVCLLHSEPPQSGYLYTSGVSTYSGFIGFGEQVLSDQRVQSIRLKHDKHALEMMQTELEDKGIHTKIRLLVGDKTEEIIKVAQEFKADLIIMGGHKQSFFADLLFGNSERALIGKAPCPLLIIPEKD